jgi:hypothetical protein
MFSKNTKNGYVLHKFSNGKIAVCKILNEYNDDEQAQDIIIKLATNNIKESELLKEYAKDKTW